MKNVPALLILILILEPVASALGNFKLKALSLRDLGF